MPIDSPIEMIDPPPPPRLLPGAAALHRWGYHFVGTAGRAPVLAKM